MHKARNFQFLCAVLAALVFGSASGLRGQGSGENMDAFREEMFSAQRKILVGFDFFYKNPESVFEKGGGMFASVPPYVQDVKDKLANQREIFKKRVDKRAADPFITEERRQKSLDLYKTKLEEVTALDENCKVIVGRIDDFLTKEIPALKNGFDIDCEDFGREEAKQNLVSSLKSIQRDFEKVFIPAPALEKKN